MPRAKVRLIHFQPEAALDVDLIDGHVGRPGVVPVMADAGTTILALQCVHCTADRSHVYAVPGLEHLRHEDFGHRHREVRQVHVQRVQFPAVCTGCQLDAGTIGFDPLEVVP